MVTKLVRIGNSRGIRIPKVMIEEAGLGETVELRVANGCLMICKPDSPRQGWREAFAAAGASQRDEVLLDLPPNTFDRDEWEW